MTLEVRTEALVALRDKYQRMLEMRRVHDSCVAHDPRPQMRALAAQFPGALREIDALPQETIEARIAELTQVIERQARVPAWMVWMVAYHGHWRAALRIRRMGLPRTDMALALRQLQDTYVAASDEPPVAMFNEETLAAVLKPTNGRLNPWVLSRIAAAHRVTPTDVHTQLLPSAAARRH